MSFIAYITRNLSIYDSLIDDKPSVEGINDLLNELHESGFTSLVNNFCSNKNPDQACDFLFEACIARMLLHNPNVELLQYEPPDEIKPPDFRFSINDVQFDLQLKRIHNIRNEQTRKLFQRECEKQLSRIPKSWYINFWIAQDFDKKYLNPFFSYLRKEIDNHVPTDCDRGFSLEDAYEWPIDDKTLVRYSFVEKGLDEPGIYPGMIWQSGNGTSIVEWADVPLIRQNIERHLKESNKTFSRKISENQSNLVVIQPDNHVFVSDSTIDDALYGNLNLCIESYADGREEKSYVRDNNGLFRPDKFSKICGVIFVPSSVTYLDESFKGTYFEHFRHQELIVKHPKPFDELVFRIPLGWKRKTD